MHFPNPKSKSPSKHTTELQKIHRNTLPFNDKRDYDEMNKGFIAAPESRKIFSKDGQEVWDIGSYDFLLGETQFDSIHPSLQRQATLNMGYGLYEVVPGHIWQVRGFDLANISFIKGRTGWIIIDALTCEETAKASLDFINATLGSRPVSALIITHSHVDHFGGMRALVDDADVRSGKIPIIAPDGFLEHSVSENVYTGTAMRRRSNYQYGNRLPHSPVCHVDQSIGKTAPRGTVGLMAPSRLVSADIEEFSVDGVNMVFHNTPGTEAPAEFNIYLPEFKAFMAAENICATIHNIYTLRGALVRDPLFWSKKINEALYRFGNDVEVMFTVHSWPRFGNKRIQEVMRAQRDTYAHLNNAVLHYANKGVTINEIHNVYHLPESLKQQWAAHSYHGSEKHNSRAVINRYLGYWDCNPATLAPLSPHESAPLYVEMMGGAANIQARAATLLQEGKYLLAVEILNKLVYAEPENQDAKDLLADAFEQLGYQHESTSLRNSYLNGAFELRYGFLGTTLTPVPTSTILAMTTGLWLDYLAICIDPEKAAQCEFAMNLITPDNNERYAVELKNGTLTNIKGFLSPAPDATVTINRSDLDAVLLGKTSLKELFSSGKASLTGTVNPFELLQGMTTKFSPNFEIMPGTQGTVKTRP